MITQTEADTSIRQLNIMSILYDVNLISQIERTCCTTRSCRIWRAFYFCFITVCFFFCAITSSLEFVNSHVIKNSLCLRDGV